MVIRVLLIDDEEPLLEIAKTFLGQEKGFKVDTSLSAQEALDKLERDRFDVIVSDYWMPGMNGIELLKKLKSTGDTTPYILFTGRGREDVAIDALNNGASFYLQRGGDPKSQFAELVNMIETSARHARAEKTLRQDKDTAQQYLDLAGIMLLALDKHGKVTLINKKGCEILGYEEDQILGKSWIENFLPESRRDEAKVIFNGLRRGELGPWEHQPPFPVLCRGGVERRVAFTNALLKDEKGEMMGTLSSGEDVTERKLAEEMLRTSESSYRQLADSIADVFFALDKDMKYTYWNKASEVLTGIPARDAIGKSLTELFPGPQGEKARKVYLEVLRTKNAANFTNEYSLGGKDHIFDITVYPIEDGVSVITKDITERMRAEDALKGSETKYSQLVELAQEGIWTIDVDANTNYANPRMAEMLGYTPEEMMGRHLFSFTDERGKEIAQVELDRRKQGIKERHDFEFLRKDGQRIYASLETSPIMDEAGNYTGALAVVADITQRKLAEHKVRERMKELNAFYSLAEMTEREGITIDQLCRELADILPKSWQYPEISCCRVVIGANEFRTENFSESPWMLSAPVRVNRSVAGRIDVGYLEKMPESDEGPFMKEERLLINAIAERLGRFAERKKAELDLASAYSRLEEAQHLAHIGTWDWLVEGDVVTWSEELYNINGRDSSLPAPSFAEQSRLFTPTSWERLSSAVKGALTTGEPYNLELELVRSDGSIRWTNGIGGVKRDEKGKVIGLHGILQDITERRRVEEALRKANKKLNLLGSVTRHDAINQLSVVFAWLEIAKEVAARDEPVHEHLARVGEAAKMIRRQLEFTADYQEIGVKRPEWIDLADAVNRGVEGLRKGKMSLNIDVAGVQVFADTMLEKVFYNLVENALRHGEKVKSISISARETKEGLTIVCEDDGIGIPADDKEKVFLRGFGKNTGFGLYMVREVLDITGVRVRETGVPGKGARFEMLVPAGNYRFGHPGQ